jgi:DNA polymerase elongation subunit (family B)
VKFFTFVRSYGKQILVRGWDDRKGGYFKEKVPYQPTLFMPSKRPNEQWHTLDGQPVHPVQPGNMRDCRDFLKDYENVDGVTVHGFERYIYQYIADEYPGEIEYDIDKIKLWSLDIETSSENGFPKPDLAEEEVLLITLKNFKTKRLITFGSRPYTPTRDDVEYVYCENEKILLRNFLAWWQDVEPEVVTGWNVELFDIPYLCNRINNLLGLESMRNLSPWRMVSDDQVFIHGRPQVRFDIAGVSVLDYLDIYKKFTYTARENYRLDTIAQLELGHKKLDHSEFETFKDFYTYGWNKFVDYNLVDVDLVDSLEEKMKLIDLVMLMAYDAKCNYTDTFAQVRLWDIIIYNYLRERNIVVPPLVRSDKKDQFIGAYVKEPVPGAYDWIVSFDLNSLYPSLIRFLNISPETLHPERNENVSIDEMIDKESDLDRHYMDEDLTIAANGAQYRKDKRGFMPELIIKMYNERVRYKKTMLQKKQVLQDIEVEMKKRGLL